MDQQTDPTVRHFRQILLWPLELIAAPSDATAAPWELLTEAEPGAVWRIVDDEFPDDPALFQERHYGEFATFLPYAQRLLYGEGPARGVGRVQSPIRVLRRTDVARARLTYPDAAEPVVLDVVHVDLYAFYDVDVVILVVELAGSDLPLRDAQDTLYRLGRAYPTHWTAEGQGGHCVTRAEWLDADGAVLAVSDYEKREKYLAHVGRYRAPRHRRALGVPAHAAGAAPFGAARPAPLPARRVPPDAAARVSRRGSPARGEPRRLRATRPRHRPGPVQRAAILGAARRGVRAPPRRRSLLERGRRGRLALRVLGRGHGRVRRRGRPLLRRPRDGRARPLPPPAVPAVPDPALPQGGARAHVRPARRRGEPPGRLRSRVGQALQAPDPPAQETFLRFTHRYWFHEISDQAQAKALYRMCRESLDTERLFTEVREEIQDMSEYLDSDSLRRQANMVIRLTVVTTVGLIGTITTGFLGMNLLAAAEASWAAKAAYFALVLVPTTGLTVWTIARSRRISDFLEALSDERLPARAKLAALVEVWRRPRPPSHPASR